MLVPGFVIGLAKQEMIPESILDQMSRSANLGMCSACSAASLKGPSAQQSNLSRSQPRRIEKPWKMYLQDSQNWMIRAIQESKSARIALHREAAYIEYPLNTLVIPLYSWAKHKSARETLSRENLGAHQCGEPETKHSPVSPEIGGIEYLQNCRLCDWSYHVLPCFTMFYYVLPHDCSKQWKTMRLWTRDARAHGSCQRSTQCIFSTKPAQLLNNFQAFLGNRIHGAGIYANIGGILMVRVNVTIYSIHIAYMDPMGGHNKKPIKIAMRPVNFKRDVKDPWRLLPYPSLESATSGWLHSVAKCHIHLLYFPRSC